MIKLKSVIWYASTSNEEATGYKFLREMLTAGYKYAILNEYGKLIMFSKKEIKKVKMPICGDGRQIVEIMNISIKLIPSDFNEKHLQISKTPVK